MIDWNRLHQYQRAMSLWHWGIAVVVISISIWLISWLMSRFREDTEDTDQTIEMLTQFRDLHQEGNLSDDEFRLIKSRLARTAQETRVIGTVSVNQNPLGIASANSAEQTGDGSTGTPATNATAKDDSKSEWMTDELTE